MSIEIGEFYLSNAYDEKNEKICIYHKSGEGGEFSKEEFEKILRKFYDEHF